MRPQACDSLRRDLPAIRPRSGRGRSGRRARARSRTWSGTLPGAQGRRDTWRAMSQENVEVVAEYARSAARGVDAMAEFWDPDISHRAAEGEIDDAGELHGPEAVRRYTQDWFDM